MTGTPERHEVQIETVAEVMAITRETITVLFHDEDRIVQLLADQRHNIHSISFPLSKASEIIGALQRIVDAEGV